MSALDLLGVGLYAKEEAARLLAVPPSTLRRWLLGYSYPLRDKARGSQPAVVAAGQPTHSELKVVTFLDLAELLVIKGFRRHGIPLQRVRIAAEQAARIVGTDHPLAALRVVTDGRSIFAEVPPEGSDGMVSLTGRGQYVFVDAVEAYLRDLDFDPSTGMASKWWPQGRNGIVLVDPGIAFGAPHVSDTGVPTSVVYELAKAGEKLPVVASWFGLTSQQAEAAVLFEQELEAA